MGDEPKGFFKRKTTWAALATILGAAAGAASGTLPTVQAIDLALNALFALTIRSAIKQ